MNPTVKRTNPPLLTEKIPEYLESFVTKQDPSLYTAIDHAAWRFIMRVSRSYFMNTAHKKYLEGLSETGIIIDKIPLITDMDKCLRKFGWRAVGVIGFIPPAVFMEFQSLGILPIACDMRSLEHIAYTPAPDIVHEAAGHAPIIADPDYAAYLRAYGEVANKAIFSNQDMDVYFAIRNLSETKEDPNASDEDVQKAQERLDLSIAAITYISEASYLARMNWWTVEYGLIGDLNNPKIYGAGLLSSVGESYNCLTDAVTKVPLSIDCINMSYDITRPQPNLFVTPDFKTLGLVLEELATMMAFRRGGLEGLSKAKVAQTPTTAELDSGIQISGILKTVHTDKAMQVCYLSYEGKCQLSHKREEIPGHGANYHREGFGTAVGKIKGLKTPPSQLSKRDLDRMGFARGEKGKLEFESGVIVEGKLTNERKIEGKLLILSFNDCTVKRGDQILFKPEWGTYDMACGTQVISVFGNAADRGAYYQATGELKKPQHFQKSNLTEKNKDLVKLFSEVRRIREESTQAGVVTPPSRTILQEINEELVIKHPEDWLLRLELLELDTEFNLSSGWADGSRKRIQEIARVDAEKRELINRGLSLLERFGHA